MGTQFTFLLPGHDTVSLLYHMLPEITIHVPPNKGVEARSLPTWRAKHLNHEGKPTFLSVHESSWTLCYSGSRLTQVLSKTSIEKQCVHSRGGQNTTLSYLCSNIMGVVASKLG